MIKKWDGKHPKDQEIKKNNVRIWLKRNKPKINKTSNLPYYCGNLRKDEGPKKERCGVSQLIKVKEINLNKKKQKKNRDETNL